MNNPQIIQQYFEKATLGIKNEWLISDHANDSWYEYIVNLDLKPKVAYMLLIFHNQVYNGGFHQYFVNGYGQFAKETVECLNKIGAIKKAQLLQQALDIVNYEKNSDIMFRKKLLKKSIKALFIEDVLFESLDKLDFEYYSLDEVEDIESLLGNYLQ